ncbi:L-threonylcarbamoyladenylate synthase [Acetanaerobacterium elongatum]|uniref:Threonylcarbamoyl-AMP synthase n=1 Tax=Acetanaerobacterium elongatum TaxID=258515 RepID=A0A1H0AVN5_9FIRM|nr:L-threonylcarbamoyladenylate synthase [Acetanaerobacterium elongatum]SDN37537.1 L-threonylcarbamoyladenylate synthase [Acetanaerobacterium elongatum]
METKLIKANADSEVSEPVLMAAEVLKKGGLVAIPTETVYGLAANALDENAVAGIFDAKGRPQDNPLIVHIAEISELQPLVTDIPEKARLLAKAFWPGPLTMIFKRSPLIPAVVSAGLDSVAIRMPSHPLARAIIKAAGVPLAAPSANLSGSPSPTCAQHVLQDLNGRIPLIIDGGTCNVGLESTVVSLVGETPALLRPGGISVEQLSAVIGEITIDKGILNKLEDNRKVSSPGMKYKHYSPKANVIILDGDSDLYCKYVNSIPNAFGLCFQEDIPKLTVPYVSFGSEKDDSEQAHLLFNALRELDRRGAKTVYARAPKQTGVSLAVYNRLLRAAGFQVIKIS